MILRLLLKAAIYLKDFDDLYQRARESTDKTKTIRKSRKKFEFELVYSEGGHTMIALSSFELSWLTGTLWCVLVKL